MSRATNAILSGADPQWERVECSSCGRVMDWPAAFASMVPANQHARPLCDRCDGSADIFKSAEDMLADIPGMVERSMIPDGVADHTLDDDVYQFLKSSKQSTLLLTGPTNAGKTTQAVNLIRRWCRSKRMPALYRTEVRMMSELKNYSNGASGKEMYRLCTAPLLVIDDVGTAHIATDRNGNPKGGWQLEQYMRIVDERFRHLKTVLTSNLELPDLWALPYIDGRIQRRLEGTLCRMPRRG